MRRADLPTRVLLALVLSTGLAFLAAGTASAEAPADAGAMTELPEIPWIAASPDPCAGAGCCTSPAPSGTSCREDSDCGKYCATNSTKAHYPFSTSSDCNGAACQQTFCDPCPTDGTDGPVLCEEVPAAATSQPV